MSVSWILKGGVGSGDRDGHPFRGNQYTNGSGGDTANRPRSEISIQSRQDIGIGDAPSVVVIDSIPDSAPGWLRTAPRSVVSEYVSDIHGAVYDSSIEIARDIGFHGVKRMPGTGSSPLSVSIEAGNDPEVDESDRLRDYASAISSIIDAPVRYHEPYFQSGGENIHNAAEIRIPSGVDVDIPTVLDQIFRDTGSMDIVRGLSLSRSSSGVRVVNFGPGLKNSEFHDLVYDVFSRHYPNATDYVTFSARTESVQPGSKTSKKLKDSILRAKMKVHAVNEKWKSIRKSVHWVVVDGL